MIRDLKVSVKILKFGFQAVMQVVLMIAFLVLGMAMELGSRGTYWMGAMLIMISPMYFAQLLYGLGMAQIVAASPYNKRFQTTIPAVGSAVLSIICMTVLVLVKYWEIQRHPELTQTVITALFTAGCMALIFNLYAAVVYKYYALSIILMILGVGSISGVYGFYTGIGSEISLPFISNASFGSIAAIGYGFVLIGALLQYALSCALYKKPLSEYAQGAMMRKYLKG